MNTVIRAANALVLAFALTATLSPSMAAAGLTTPGKLNAEGRMACQRLDGNGYTAKIRGHQSADRNFFDSFNIRYCFASKQECTRFVESINHVIYPIETIRYSNCKKT